MTSQAPLLTVERQHSETASEAVIRALSMATGAEPTAFTPLYESIEPDALDDLFQGNTTGTETRSIRFTHDDYLVVCRNSAVSVLEAATPQMA